MRGKHFINKKKQEKLLITIVKIVALDFSEMKR
jgi:hypothetical protein